MQSKQEGGITVVAIVAFSLIAVFITWTYVWFDSARNYVHGSLANQMIELKLQELKFIDGAISSLEAHDVDMARKRIEALREIHQEDLQALSKGLESEGSWMDYFTISPENMEKLRGYLKNRTFEINANEEGVSVETYQSS